MKMNIGYNREYLAQNKSKATYGHVEPSSSQKFQISISVNLITLA
jgi:hypothetical protein